MRRLLLRLAVLALGTPLLASPAQGSRLLGVTFFDGELWEIDPLTADTTHVGSTFGDRLNSLTFHDGLLYSVSNESDELIGIDPATGVVVSSLPITFGTHEVDVRSLAFSSDGRLFAVNQFPRISLHEIDLATGQLAAVGDLPNSPFQALEFSPSGVLYGWNFASGLVTVDTSTAALTDVGAIVGEAMQSIAFDADGTLYGILNGADFGRSTGLEVHSIDPATGVHTVSASTGLGGPPLRGIAFVAEPGVASLLGLGGALLAAAVRRGVGWR